MGIKCNRYCSACGFPVSLISSQKTKFYNNDEVASLVHVIPFKADKKNRKDNTKLSFTDVPGNFMILCQDCNSRKGSFYKALEYQRIMEEIKEEADELRYTYEK